MQNAIRPKNLFLFIFNSQIRFKQDGLALYRHHQLLINPLLMRAYGAAIIKQAMLIYLAWI